MARALWDKVCRTMTATPIDRQLERLPDAVKETLKRHHFDVERFKQRAEKLRAGTPFDNKVRARIEPPLASDVVSLPTGGTADHAELTALGHAALSRGEVALVVLAGGMATRMGGVIKALVEALPGRSFLDMRLSELDWQRKVYGRAAPLWLMTSHTTDEPTRAALAHRIDRDAIAVFPQYLSLRLTPQGDVFLDENGEPSLHSPGHGDLPDALRESGLLARFVEHGGRVVMMTNIDNLGGTLEPAVVGFHLKHGLALTSEVVDKLDADRGGIPVRVDGRCRVLEELRIPESFDPATVRVFNTNVFQFDAKALLELDMEWNYYKVDKKVDGKPVVQFERIVNEVTGTLDTRYLHMPRTGAASRFLPVKDMDELAARASEIEAVARTRGMLA
jgi:UTP--glucose-1-phosphate uridylyltransferase